MAKRLKRLIGFFVFAAFTFFLPSARPALAGSPTKAIQETIETVFTILRDPALQGEEKKGERHALLRKIVAARFDFQEMAKRALGPHWKRYNNAEQERFVVLFSDFLGAVYVDTIEQGIKAKIFYLNEDVDDGYARVDTKVVLSGSDGLNVGYNLRHVREEWKVYDVSVADMKIIQWYRNQFNHFLYRHSFNELLDTIQKKIEKLRK